MVDRNKKTCNSLMDRVQTAESAIRTLLRRKQENEREFLNNEYYKAFIRFVDAMKKIKEFIKDLSQLQGYKKYTMSSTIEDGFNNLIKEFETTLNDLNFTMNIANEEKRRIDQISLKEILKDSLVYIQEFLDKIECDIVNVINRINEVHQINASMLQLILKKFEEPDLPTIDPKEIIDPLIGKETDCRGEKEPFIYKKYYKAMEVACVQSPISDDDALQENKKQVQLDVLEKTRDSPNILKFYGLSHVNDQTVMVVEWAELGSLREVYKTYDIAWPSKVKIALDICRGITFLHTCSILHHDIRCANIMMTSLFEPKITGFGYARLTASTSATTSMTELTDNRSTKIIHWLAPEKLRCKDQPYNTKCEIFSFGMLLWELAFEKIPYENWNTEKIKRWVLSGKRERLVFGKDKPEIEELQKEFKELIEAAWQDDPQIRAPIQFLIVELNKLVQKYHDPRSNFPALKPDKTTMDFDEALYENDPVSACDSGGKFECDLGNLYQK